MNRWLIGTLALSLFLLVTLKAQKVSSLAPIFSAEKTIKLDSFSEARKVTPKKDLDLLKLWESILTGRSAPVARHMKERYKILGLNHVFTPSGFHLSAALFPFLKLIKHPLSHIFWLGLIGLGLTFLPGLGALKRMVLIKIIQKKLGLRLGFGVALFADITWGTFQKQTLSFTYSLLFMGIIYSGLRGLKLLIWFFFAQLILAYFQDAHVSILILIFSPILNLIFTAIMPALLILSFPLWEWQLKSGLIILRHVQTLVDFCAYCCASFPMLESHVGLMVILTAVIFRKKKIIILGSIFFCSSLNFEQGNLPTSSALHKPLGEFYETIYREKYVLVKFRDGVCKMKLVRGFWFESCSPIKRRRSSGVKKISLLSYPSSEQQTFFLHVWHT
jgi:hypothetical protein